MKPTIKREDWLKNELSYSYLLQAETIRGIWQVARAFKTSDDFLKALRQLMSKRAQHGLFHLRRNAIRRIEASLVIP